MFIFKYEKKPIPITNIKRKICPNIKDYLVLKRVHYKQIFHFSHFLYLFIYGYSQAIAQLFNLLSIKRA